MEGRDPAAADLAPEAADVVDDVDILRKAREEAGGERTRGSERRPAESERCSIMYGARVARGKVAGVLNSGCILGRLSKEGERYWSWFSEGIRFGIVK